MLKSDLKITAIVFAAGRGSRLMPLTNDTPKPMLKVSDKTLLEWNLDNIIDMVDNIVIVVNYLGQQIVDYIGEKYKGKNVEFVWQNNPKGGTLDAFRAALYESKSIDNTSNYIVLNADDIHGPEIYEKFKKNISNNPEMAILSARYILNLDQLKTLGVYEVDSENYLQNMHEKPQKFVSNLANSGLYYLPNKSKELISKTPNQSDKEEYITTDLFNKYLLKYKIKILYSQDMWLQISNPTDLKKARDLLA